MGSHKNISILSTIGYISPTGGESLKLMRYLWSLLLAYNRLDVNVNVRAANPHELKQNVIADPVSLFRLYMFHCGEAALANVRAPKHAGH